MSHDLPPHEPAPAQRDDGGWYGTSTPARSRRSLSTVAVAIGAALALGAAALVLGAGGEWPASARRHDAASDAADRLPSAAPTTTKPLLTGPDVAPTTTTGTATTIPGGPTTTEKDIIANPDEGETDAGVTYVLIADDTGQIGVEVPDTWVEVDGRPLTGVNGEVVPNVQASTDLENFRNTFESPGVSFTQLTNPIDPNDGLNYLTASNGSARGCVEQLREPYDDGVFVGLYAIFDGCGGVNSRFVQIVANGQNGHGFEISVQLLADDSFEIANHIAQTFNYAEDPNATTVPGPATTVAPGPATTVAPGPATTVPGAATTVAPGPATTVPGPATTASGASLVPVTDDSGTLTIQVPATWVDRDTSPIVLDDGTPINAVSASTDLQAFHNGYTVSGIDATGLGNVDTAQAVPILAGSAISADCTADAAGVTPVQSPTWTGSQQIYTACTGGGSVYVVAVNRVDDPNRGVQMIIIVGPTDPTSIADQIIAGVLGS